MSNFRVFSIVLAILFLPILFIVMVEYLLLELLGFHYNSWVDLVFFFILYFMIEMPMSIFVNAIPKALKSVGVLKSSQGMLPFVLNILTTFIVLMVLDHYMHNIELSWQGTFVFALVTGILWWFSTRGESEPPTVESEAYEELSKKFSE